MPEGSKEAARKVAEEKLRKQADELAAKEGIDPRVKDALGEALGESTEAGPEPDAPKGKSRGFNFGGKRQ
jgi:hypothetical protein